MLYGANGNLELKTRFRTNLGITLNDEGIYDTIKGNTFVEKLGVYYQEEIKSLGTTDANKTKKRVITYLDT